MSPEPLPAFLADAMLGKLARWLVLMGYDAAYGDSTASDGQLVARAQREERVFLTRDRRIPEASGLKRVVVREGRLDRQLKQVFEELRLAADPTRWFTRCTECNWPLEALSREEALPLAPPKVREMATAFRRCALCARLYWEGTHVEKVRDRLTRWGFGGPAQSPDEAAPRP